MKWDGHTHTHFCRHGSKFHAEEYVKQAIELGFERYTISEHPPVPDGLIDDEEIMATLAMSEDELPEYMACASELKERYAGTIEVTVGLELDYLYKNEHFTENIIQKWGDKLEDVLISVHYLPGKGGMRCIDFSPDDFRTNLLDHYGSVEAVVDEYYNHIELAIASAAAWPMRKRLGHVNLIEKFRLALPQMNNEQLDKQLDSRLKRLIPLLAESGVDIDLNMAGLRKDTCRKPYAPKWFVQACLQQGIACVYGSDTHHPQDVGAGWEQYTQLIQPSE
ncbi:histidinol-phosphatase HisJ [Paenibacillaceae bacterium]|nr:histidinol-phosphatase HisJ [Paenibacillaceae bacterium]